MSDLSLRIATSEEDVLKVLVVRGIVFIEEQKVDWEGEIDAFEKTATHFLGEVGGQPVATGRLRHLEDGWVKVERIAVRPRWRGRGYAKEIVGFMLDDAEAAGPQKFKMHAQVYLEDFYREFGFRREGDIFDECGIDHILMVREDTLMFYYQRFNQFFAQVAGGLEQIAAKELKALGATDGEILTRGIHFKADLETLYRINYRSRLVTRVLAPLVKFECTTPEQLYLGAKKVDWTNIFTLEQTFAVFANTFHSEVDHSQFAALKVKDCVVDMFRKRYKNKRPNVDAREPDLIISVHIFDNQATVSIDCSGGSLHRRGYRQESVEAPMQETLAAGIIDFAEWDCKRPLYDPMCGSGTLLSEAWLKAGYIPPGTLRKHFGFMMLPDYDRRDWVKVKFQEDNKIKLVRGGLIRGSDINAKAVKMTRNNNARIPGGDELIVKTHDFRDLDPLENRLIVCNPPYGIRMKKDDDMGAFMKEFGDFLKQKCTGSDAFIYFGDRELVKSFGLKPAFKMPLRNGGLDGRLVKYELY